MKNRSVIINGPPSASGKPWFTITNAAAADGPAEILIYEQIGKDWWDGSGVDAKAFAEAIKAIPADQQINVSINSPGGNVWDGLAIYHQLQARRDMVTTRVDGIAASIASVIALAGRELTMPKNALLMIHDPAGLVMGNADEFRKMAAELDKIANNLADIYATKSGKPAAEIRAKMIGETWFDGADAKAYGLADVMIDEVKIAANFDLSAFRRVPAKLKPTANHPANSGAAPIGDTMNKKAIIALLKKHGVEMADNATDANIIAELDKLVIAGKCTADDRTKLMAPAAPPNASAPADTIPANIVQQVIDLTAQLNAERSRRIEASFDQITANNPAIDRSFWLPQCLRDETILAQLRAMPGGTADPVRASVSDAGNPLVEEYRALSPGAARNAFRLENELDCRRLAPLILDQAQMGAYRRYDPQNANTLAAALTPDYLADGLIINARNRLAPLAAFSRDFGVDPMKPKSTVQVARATVGATGQTDATNWESGDTTLAAVGVTVSQKSVSFHLTNDQLNKGHQLANLAGINADQFCDLISDVWTALLVVGTYGTPTAGNGVIGLATAFDPADIPQLFALAKNFRKRNLILDGSYIGYLMPGVIATFTSGLGVANGGQSTYFGSIFGMDGIWMQSRYTSAVANCVGFLCAPDAIAVASGIPISTATPSGEFLSQQIVNVDDAGSNTPSIGLSVQINTWYSRATRTIWASYDVMFGAAAGDASTTLTLGQGRLLVSA